VAQSGLLSFQSSDPSLSVKGIKSRIRLAFVSLFSRYAIPVKTGIHLESGLLSFQSSDPFGSEFREGKTSRLQRLRFLVDGLSLEQAR
jgi:hypothetical protein